MRIKADPFTIEENIDRQAG